MSSTPSSASTSTQRRPWHGVLVATALPMRPTGPDGALVPDLDTYAEHVRWLVANGCDGVIPNGSLGEYQTLTTDERAAVVRTAVEAADGAVVMPGVGAYGAAESRRWAEQAGEAGAACVMLLPPNAYRADERAVVEHYREVARAGLPVVAYNNPFDTKVDLTLDLLVGSDDVAFELEVAGAVGWVAGYPNALPDACVRMWRAFREGDHATGL